jgi:hypothetical protein
VRVVREAVVKVPTDRTALLPMPLHWLCDGHFAPSSDGSYQSDCADDTQTCVAGQCVDAVIETQTLKDYKPELVFGGGDEQGKGGHCIDVPACFAASVPAVPDGDCTLTLPTQADASAFNIALELSAGSDGECTVEPNSRCFLPLDSDEVEGWSIQNGRVQLPPPVCDVIAHGKALGVVTTSACPTKDSSVPICGAWTNVSTSSMSAGGDSTATRPPGKDGGSIDAPDSSVGSSGTAGGTSSGTGLGCQTNDQCGGGMCVKGVCEPPCASDRACPGMACIRTAGTGACEAVPCAACPAGTACSELEGFCRMYCKTSAECWPDQSCSSAGLCDSASVAMPVDAGAPGGGGASGAGGTGGGGGPDAGTPSMSQSYRLIGSVRRGTGITFTEQGQLFDSKTVPIANTVLTFAFALYSQPSAGTQLWTESQPVMTGPNGTFVAALGNTTPIGTDVLATTPLFLGIQIGTDTEMAPRQQVQ